MRIGFKRCVVVFFDTGFDGLGEAVHDALHRLQALKALFHRLRQRFVGSRHAGVIGVAQGAAILHRDFERAQCGYGVRIREVGAIGVPEHAGIVAADVLAVFLDVGNDKNLRVFNMKLLGDFQFTQFAKARAEANLILVGQRLAAEVNHLVLVKRRTDLRKRRVVERPREIGADDFSAERGAAGFDLYGHGDFLFRRVGSSDSCQAFSGNRCRVSIGFPACGIAMACAMICYDN